MLSERNFLKEFWMVIKKLKKALIEIVKVANNIEKLLIRLGKQNPAKMQEQ